MTKEEYLKETPNPPLVVCEKHKLARCVMDDDGFKCPKCNHVYPYERVSECITTM